MLILGILFLILGLVFGVPMLTTIGLCLVLVALVFMLLGQPGPFSGRWW